MSMPRRFKTLLIVVLTLLVISLLPSVAFVWAEADSNLVGTGLDSASLIPLGQGEGPNVRPSPDLHDMIVQYGASSGDISGQSDGSGVEIIPAAAFGHMGNVSGDQANSWLFWIGAGYVRNDSATDQACLVAPTYLPPGAIITGFTVYVVDNSASNNITFYLARTYDWGAQVDLAVVQSVGSSSSIQILTDPSITPGANLILPNYNYQVDFCIPANSGTSIRVNGAQVNYSLQQSVYLPVIQKPNPSLTYLTVTNNTGGTVNVYKLTDTTSGSTVAQCTNIPSGGSQFCGSFLSSSYNAFGDFAACGAGSSSTPIFFAPGDCTRVVTCDGIASMTCNGIVVTTYPIVLDKK